MKSGVLKWIITICAIGLALLHVLRPELNVDAITVALLAIAVVPWLAPLFKSVELPGGLKVEYRDLVEAKKKAEEAGLVSSVQSKSTTNRRRYAYETVVGHDPNLALAGLRIEIETRLRDIAMSHSIDTERRSIGQVANQLKERGVLKELQLSALLDLLPLLNSAAHGATVDERASQWAADIGPQLLQSLDALKGERQLPTLLERWKNRDGDQFLQVGEELSKLLVQSPEGLLRSMHEDPESFASWLDEMEVHTFTLFHTGGELDDELFTAYYEKLRELMKTSVVPFVNSEYGSEAKRILEKLDRVQIRRIW